MRAAVLLLLAAYAVAVAAAGTWWLPQASWPQRAPRLGIAVWQALTITVIASALVAGVLLAVPCLQVWADWASVRACVVSLRAQYASAGGALASTSGLVLAVGALARFAWFLVTTIATAQRSRACHDETLALVSRRGPAPGTVLLEDDRPVVYCVPGRRRIVLTTGALRRLDDRQLEAVLAHERAHLAGRHHLVIVLAEATRRAFPQVPFFATAARQISCLVEMAADDAATRRAHRLTLAGALLTLAAARVPSGALGASDLGGAQRIRRLIDSPRPVGRSHRIATSVLALIAAPVVAFSAPALALIAMSDCPPGTAQSHLIATARGALHRAGPQQPVLMRADLTTG